MLWNVQIQEAGQMMVKYPLLKNANRFKRKKVICALGMEQEGGESEEDPEKWRSHIVFMVIEKDINESNEIEVSDDNPSYDDLECAYEELKGDMEKLLKT